MIEMGLRWDGDNTVTTLRPFSGNNVSNSDRYEIKIRCKNQLLEVFNEGSERDEVDEVSFVIVGNWELDEFLRAVKEMAEIRGIE